MKRIMLFLIPLFALLAGLPALAAPTCLVGAKGVAPTATLTWVAPTFNTDGTPVITPLSYNIYQGTASGTEVKVASVSVLNSTISTGLKASTSTFWYVTAVDPAGVESLPSVEVCKSFPASQPGTVTVTIT